MWSRTVWLTLTSVLLGIDARAQNANIILPEGASIIRDLQYVPNGHERQVLDLYLPADPSQSKPLIIVVHGGGWRGGDKAANVQVAWGVPFLLNAGYVVASLNHRLSQHATFPAQIHDVKAATRWLRVNSTKYGIDGRRVGAWGMSSGGHLVALLGTSADVAAMDGDIGAVRECTRIQAVVIWFGPTDFFQMDGHRLPDGMMHNLPDSPESRLIGASIQSAPTLVQKANPITYVSSDDPPFLIFHGDRDRSVPHHQSEILRDALLTAGVQVTMKTLAGAGHGTPEFRVDEIARAMIAFFDQHLRAIKP